MSGLNKKRQNTIDEEIDSEELDNISEDNHQENMNNIYNELDLDTNKSQSNNKILYINKSKFKEEDQNNIKSSNKVDFKEVMQNFDFADLGETNKAKLSNNLKKLINKQEKEKVSIKFNDSDTKRIEREMNYDKLSKEITEYQNKVKINREADILDFTVKNKKLNFTSKSLAKNSSDLNPMEKAINEVLVKNNYMTDEKILEKENNINIDPNEVAKRYDELKKIKHLLFQKELKSKRVAKIKSKLYHKIKKKQSDREEIKILTQLQEIDPSAVKEYVEKKKLDRIKERLSLKHSLNSKFAKTVKKYNLHKDQNTKDAIIENLKLKDKLLQKISGQDENMSEADLLDEDEENIEDKENDVQDISDEDSNKEEIEEDDLMINFNDPLDEQKAEDDENLLNKGGVFGMKFMNKSNEYDKNINLNDKMKKVLESVKKDENEEGFEDEDNAVNEEKINLPKKAFARQKHILEGDTLKKPKTQTKDEYTIDAETLNEINNQAKDYSKVLENKAEIDEEDYKKMIELENINNENEFVNKFLVKNKQNEIEFYDDQKNAAIKKIEDDNQFLQGWDSWAGDSKAIQSKEYLRKKRQQERIEKLKQNMKLSKVLMNNSVDKKASNYLVKELPHPFKSETEYHKLNDSHAGIEWNTLSMYKKLIQPTIVKKIGQIIEPMKINDNTTAKKLCEIIEKSTKKKTRTKANI